MLVDNLAVGNTPVGMVTDNTTGLVEARRHMGIDPVMITVARHIHDIGKDLMTGRNPVPQKFERPG